MALTNDYTTGSNKISTSISGGRTHYGYRQPIKATDTYEYITSSGENLHSLSAVIFGTDSDWWALQDINAPIDSFAMQEGDTILLPTDLIKNIGDRKKFFG